MPLKIYSEACLQGTLISAKAFFLLTIIYVKSGLE